MLINLQSGKNLYIWKGSKVQICFVTLFDKPAF